MVKLVGYCCEDDNLGVAYDLDSLDTAQNLLREGTIFLLLDLTVCPLWAFVALKSV